MRILFAGSEVQPFSKTGGLADVLGALPQALVALGHEVLVVSPWYRTLNAEPLWTGDVDVPFDGGFTPVGVGTLEHGGVRHAFVGHADFQRDALYGFADDVRRFSLFTRAVPAVADRLGFLPDVVHAHDWHAAYLPLVLERGWHLPPGFPFLPAVLTVHNVQFQGESGLAETVRWLRLPESAQDSFMNHFGRANALQAGLGAAHRVTTVSPTYAREIQRPAYGWSLDGTFRHIAGKLSGILNGLDVRVWNPAQDPCLDQPYSAADLSGKAHAKAQLAQMFGFDAARPLLAVVSRLAEQKGIDVLLAALPGLLEQGWALFVLGSGDPQLERALLAAANEQAQVAVVTAFDEVLAHRAYAAADALAIPSRFEPCGLTQMIAMRYGTLPVARATGGLLDTITHLETGFLFSELSETGLLGAGRLALDLFGTPAWDAMVHRALQQDFSWSVSAERYSALYSGIVGP
jgi:starch synthase